MILKSYIKMVLQVLRRLDYILIYIWYRMRYGITPRQVLFLSDSRNTMTGNFNFIEKALDESYIIKKHLYESSLMKHDKKSICKDMATSQYILIDDFYPIIYPIPLRKQTKLIQVWHAVGAFKTVGFARKQNHDRFSMTHRHYTDTIVSSESIRKDYAKAFRMDIQDVHSYGIPRTDIFFDKDYKKQIKKDLYDKYPMLKGKKVILFAPTFRGNDIHKAYYDFSQIHFSSLQQSLGEDYVCIIKLHPFIKNKYQETLDPQFYIDLTSMREINDLLFITDILITDYSSVIFEASLLDIQTIFFAYDLQEYIQARDFFYSYEEYTYGPVVKNQKELEKAILNPNDYSQKKEKFQKKFMSSCDGKSTKRFVEQLLGGKS